MEATGDVRAEGPRLGFGVLGTLQVHRDGTPVRVSAAKQRSMLAALLVRAGRPVSIDELAECVWADDEPRRAVPALRVYAMRLRRALGEPGPIETTSTGYVLRVGDGDLDLCRFEDLAARGLAASAAGGPGAAVALFDRALAEWRGPALADVSSEFLHRVEVPRLRERRLDVEAARNDAMLRDGGHRALVGPLRRLTELHPLREQFWAQLMLAQYRSGDGAAALDAYRAVRDLLAEELGIDPGQEVEDLRSAILARDPSLDPVPAPRESAAVAPPSQVAPVVSDFVGREDDAEAIAGLLGAGGTGATAPEVMPAVMPVVTVCGAPGVGKTALAAFVARRTHERFPDGQLFADLRGHSAGAPRATTAVLAGFLRALGVPPDQVPVERDEQAAVYRAMLDGRRVLVVLDNAASAEQVRPLLPGTPGCAVLVTSRHELRGLIVTNDARLVPLGVLEPAAAAELLTRILGEDAVAGQAGAVERLAELCGYLPLALRTAAANLAGRVRPDVSAYVREFGSGRLAALATESGEVATRAAFDLSYAELPPPVQRTFQLLGLVPGPDFTPEAVAALTGVPVVPAARRLERLATANLVQRRAGGRYHLHDLLRDYALLRRAERIGEAEARAALVRLLAWYLHAADRASAVLHPGMPTAAPAAPPPAAPLPEFADHRAARGWLDHERLNLLAAAEHGARSGLLPLAWQIVDRLWVYLGLNGHHAEQLATTNAVLAAAHEQGDTAAETVMRLHLGWAHRNLGDHPVALWHLRRVLAAGADGPEPRVVSAAHGVLAGVLLDLGRLAEARDHLEHMCALDESDAAWPFLRSWALIGLGAADLIGGHPSRARARLGAAAELARGIRAPILEAEARALLGRAATFEDDLDAAIDHLRAALDLAHRTGIRLKPLIMIFLADALDRAGSPTVALSTAKTAVDLVRQDGGRWFDVTVRNVLGTILQRRGEAETAVTWHEEARERAEVNGFPYGLSQAHLGLAHARLRSGDPEAGLLHAHEALSIARRHGFAFHEAAAANLVSDCESHFTGLGSKG
ncbi:AfsR/SARP family transcriptional regulator [Actinomadura roseirufa]|uniref:AfsR/SARP family transcriptional regulator n=1 Tax=Actinomadura roseirufa TaxID=2094049 RepID=UPI0010414E72|nr:BTAD domain-containing putative transcriptional regulator [Actinomadura roseirufa]